MSDLNILAFCNDNQIYRRRIDGWFIEIRKNFIRGNVRTFGYNFPLFIKGEILGFVPGIVMARINGDVYALTLGPIDPCHADDKDEYFDYLETKCIDPIIIL
jgi:hypothetical protein